MTAFSHETPPIVRVRATWLELPEFWAAIAIVVIWLATSVTDASRPLPSYPK